MFKTSTKIVALFSLALVLSGCGAAANANPATPNSDFKMSYVEFPADSGTAVHCYTTHENSKHGTLTCDFEDTLPAKDVELNDTYEITYQVVKGDTVGCISQMMGSQFAVISCDFTE